MTEAAAQQTESMEDILHSIRRIIANDPASEAAGDAPVGVPMDEEPLELTEVLDDSAAKTVDPMDAIQDAMMSTGAMEEEVAQPAPQPEPEPVFVAAPPPPPPAPKPSPVVIEIQHDSLLADNAAEASANALKNLVNSIPKPKVESMLMRSGSTLEDLVVESLKPELSEWLNKNLPTLVQSLVEKEIRKLIPRD